MFSSLLECSIWVHSKCRSNFTNAISVSFDDFVRENSSILECHRASPGKTGRCKIVVDDGLLFFVPPDNGFAAISPVVDRVQDANGIAIQGPLPPRDIGRHFFPLGIFKLALPSFVEPRAKR